MVNDNGVYKRHCAATNLAVSLSIRENGFSRLRRPLLTFVSKKKNYPKEFFNLSIRLKIIYRETTPSCRSLEPKEKGERWFRERISREIRSIESRLVSPTFREGGKQTVPFEFANLCRKRTTLLANASTRHVALLLKVASCARSCRFAPFSNQKRRNPSSVRKSNYSRVITAQ